MFREHPFFNKDYFKTINFHLTMLCQLTIAWNEMKLEKIYI